MKKSLLQICAVILFLSCENSKKELVETTIKFPIKGVWELTTKYAYEDNILTDSLVVADKIKQIKIFATSKYMWSRAPLDSIDWHAYGTYKYDGKTLIENKEFNSLSMDAHSKSVVCKIIIDNNYYTQIFVDSKGLAYYAEKFRRIE